MPIPKSRQELVNSITTTFNKLQSELDSAGPSLGSRNCVDDWTVKDLLVVRVWWTEHIVQWVEAGKRDESPTIPAEGYRWTETPRLNTDTVAGSQRESYRSVRVRLKAGYESVLELIAQLTDQELLNVGAFEWADKWPIARWISMNTARQYATARTHVRRAIREMHE